MTTTSIGAAARADTAEQGPDGQVEDTASTDGRTPSVPSLRDHLVVPMPTDRLAGWLWPLAVTVLAGILRFWRLGQPPQIVFDETYYVKDAYSLLQFGYERQVVSVPEGDDAPPPIDAQILDGRTDIFGPDPSYVVHPPVGKWMIALGEQLFGLTPFGWRFGVALFGTLTVLILARLARRMFRSTLLGTVAGLLLALDGLAIVMGRTALLDGLLAFWLVAGVACLLVDRDQGRLRLVERMERMRATGRMTPGGPSLGIRWWRVGAGACFGLACGTKWSGLFVLAVAGLMIVVWDVAARRAAGVSRPYSAGILYDGLPAFVSTVGTALVVYVGSWGGWLLSSNASNRTWGADNPATGLGGLVPDALRSLWHYHAEVFGFHTELTSDHPYAAHPIKWLVLGRPTQFEFTSYDAASESLPTGVTVTPEVLCGAERCARDIIGVGTPVIWWAACLALVACLVLWVGRRDWRAGAILAIVGATWLPWFGWDERPIFFFYAVAILPFLVLAVTLVLGYVLGPPGATRRRRTWGAVAVGAYLLLALANTSYFYPVLSGDWIPYDAYAARMWFRTWI